jgi:hypothetical protein
MVADRSAGNRLLESPRDPSTGLGTSRSRDLRATDYGGFYRDRPVMITGRPRLHRQQPRLEARRSRRRVLIVDSLIDDYGGNLFNICGLEDRLRVNIADVRQQTTMNYLVRDRT